MAKKILIVDDDPDLVMSNRLVLESAGYEVTEATSGAEALAEMRQELPDLVLMDVMMANPLDGYTTTNKIGADPELRDVPIIMVSSITSSQYASSFPTDQYLNVAEFVSKPIEPEALLQKIERHLK